MNKTSSRLIRVFIAAAIFFAMSSMKVNSSYAAEVSGTLDSDTRFAVLGDSISTFEGYCEDEYLYREYPNRDVDEVDKTWWGLLKKSFGIREYPAVSAVITSSFFNQDNEEVPPLYSNKRIERLGENGDPDIIFIAGGTNDLFTENTGEALTRDELEKMEDPDTSYTNVGLALTIDRVQKRYPDAEIILLLPAVIRFDTEGVTSEEHYQQLADMMAETADNFGIETIDLGDCGITADNVDQYKYDGIHPNAAGMRRMANYIADQFSS